MNHARMSEVPVDDCQPIQAHRRFTWPSRLRVVQVLAYFAMAIFVGLGLSTSYNAGPLAFSHDGTLLIAAVNAYHWPKITEPLSSYGVVKRWNAQSGQALARLAGMDGWVRSIALSQDDTILAVGASHTEIQLWDPRKGIKLAELGATTSGADEVVFAPDRLLLASSGYEKRVQFWDMVRRKEVFKLSENSERAYTIAFAPDGKTLATVEDDRIRIWNTNDGHLEHTIVGSKNSSHQSLLGFSADSKDCILVRHEGRHGEVAAVVTGSTLAERFAMKPRRRIAMQLSPDSGSIAIGDEGRVSIVNANTGQTLMTAREVMDRVGGLAFSKDGERLAASDESGRIYIWDATTGELQLSLSVAEPLRRWGPAGVSIIVFVAATLRLRWLKRNREGTIQ